VSPTAQTAEWVFPHSLLAAAVGGLPAVLGGKTWPPWYMRS